MTDKGQPMAVVAPSITPPLLRDLLLRETNHRCTNDLQLVVSLLALQGSKALSAETRVALRQAQERVSILARSRRTLQSHNDLTLENTLHQVCEALGAIAEPRSISLVLEAAGAGRALSQDQVTRIALAVNELVTNAIKHAFEESKSGEVTIRAFEDEENDLILTVDDDGLPLPESTGEDRLGLDLVRRLIKSVGGTLVMPMHGSKVFEIRVPMESHFDDQVEIPLIRLPDLLSGPGAHPFDNASAEGPGYLSL